MLSEWLVATRYSSRNLTHARISNSSQGFSRGLWAVLSDTHVKRFKKSLSVLKTGSYLIFPPHKSHVGTCSHDHGSKALSLKFASTPRVTSLNQCTDQPFQDRRSVGRKGKSSEISRQMLAE
jgi:hypothetical protein